MAINWQKGTAVTGSGLYYKCIWAGGSINKFVAVGARAGVTKKIATSPDGLVWTAQTVPQNNDWCGIAFDGTTLVVVSTTGVNRVITSTDAVTWTPQVAAAANQWADVCWSPSVTAIGGTGQFVAVGASGASRVMTSPDGVTWTPQTAASALTWAAIDWSPSLQLYVATALSASAINIMTSADGITWASQTNPLGAIPLTQCGVVWGAGAGKFVAGVNTSSNKIISSSDGINWFDWAGVPSGWGSHPVSRPAWSQDVGLFLASSNDTVNTVVTSPDGSTWTTVTISDGVTDFTKAWGAVGYSTTLQSFAVMLNSDSADIVAFGTLGGMAPTSGHLGGGYSLSITGDGSNGGFSAGARVFIDDLSSLGTIDPVTDQRTIGSGIFNEATNVVVVDGTHITCNAPIGLSSWTVGQASRLRDVMVLNSNAAVPNVAFYLADGFTYLNPTISSVVASSGPAAGGTAVTITGTNFWALGDGTADTLGNRVYFGGNLATSVVVVSSTSITCNTPISTSTTNPVDVIYKGTAYSTVLSGNGAYPYLNDTYCTVTLPASFTYTASWFTLSSIPAELIEDAQLDADTCSAYWAFYLGVDLAEFLCTEFHRRPFKLPRLIPIHWYTYGFYRPGSRWTGTTEPAKYGWFQSVDGYAGASTLIIGDAPHNPRSFTEIISFATGGAGMLGGYPGVGTNFRNHFIYASGGYTVGVTSPSIRIFDGLSDREIISMPLTAAGVIPKAIMSMLLVGETIYVSTLDSGTTDADFSGRVFAFEPLSGNLTQIGAAFTGGEVPYALCWHMGRLWCGTNQGSGVSGKIYYFRPGIDSAWTTDYDLATSTVGGACSMVSYNGSLYVGSDNAAGSFAKVLVRTSLGAWSTSTTATGGTARVNNGFLYLKEFNSNLYAGYWNPDTPAVAKIYKYDGTSWSTVYTGAAGTLRPYIGMFVLNNALYTIGGGNQLTAVLLTSTNGTSWTDLSPQLTGADATAVPVFGEVVI